MVIIGFYAIIIIKLSYFGSFFTAAYIYYAAAFYAGGDIQHFAGLVLFILHHVAYILPRKAFLEDHRPFLKQKLFLYINPYFCRGRSGKRQHGHIRMQLAQVSDM